jgi:hypothetical protein
MVQGARRPVWRNEHPVPRNGRKFSGHQVSNKQKPRDIRRKYSRLDRPRDDATLTTCGRVIPTGETITPMEETTHDQA